MKTVYELICPVCKTKGRMTMTENDQPFSKPWESYRLDNVKGRTTNFDHSPTWDEVFEQVAPHCVECGHELNQSNLAFFKFHGLSSIEKII